MEYYTYSASLPVKQFISVDTLLRMLFYPLAFYIGEFRNEVSDRLSLHGGTWMVLYVEFA